MSSFGAELEDAKKMISSLVSQQIHKEHNLCKGLSQEIHQQQRKVVNHIPTTEISYRLAMKQYKSQDNGDREMRNIRKYLENDEDMGRKNIITLKTNRKSKSKDERRC